MGWECHQYNLAIPFTTCGHVVKDLVKDYKDLVKALKEYRRDSLYFQGLLKAQLAGIVAVPFDLKHLFCCLTNKTEYKLWKVMWKDLLKNALPSLLKDPETTRDGNGDALTLDHLSGEGEWTAASDQAAGIPKPILEQITEAAERAFLEMQPLGPLPPYSEIFQGATEPYVQFVERLTTAVEQQVKKEHAREEVIEEMAFSHANERCHVAILTLPHKPLPTLQDMLQIVGHMVLLMGPLPAWVIGKENWTIRLLLLPLLLTHLTLHLPLTHQAKGSGPLGEQQIGRMRCTGERAIGDNSVPSRWSLIGSGTGEGEKRKEAMGENPKRVAIKKTKGRVRDHAVCGHKLAGLSQGGRERKKERILFLLCLQTRI